MSNPFFLNKCLLPRAKHWFITLLTLALVSQACSARGPLGVDFNPPPIATPPPAVATGTPMLLQPTVTPVIPVLTVAQLRNATLTISGADQQKRTVVLKDGKYEKGTDPAQPGYDSITVGENIAFGDLNGDGAPDAAIILAENYGGSGVFISVVAIINQGGQPVAVASAIIDDRAIVNIISIQDGEIFVDATIHSINDPSCCPSLASTHNYRLVNGTLALSRITTTIPGNAERVIKIESPTNDTQINGVFIIKGSVTVAPFENNLSYSIFQPGSSEPVEQAGFIIKADTMGGPGTFELSLDLNKNITSQGAFSDGPIRIQISDMSPADGSYLAVNTVYLVLKRNP